MSSHRPSQDRMPLRATQIMVFAMMMGVVIFATVTIFVQLGSEPDPKFERTLLLGLGGLGLFLSVGLVAVRSLLGKKLSERVRKDPEFPKDGDIVPQEFVGRLIASVALIEGFGLAGCVVRLITGNPWALAAPALALLGMGVLFPTKASAAESLKQARHG